MQTVVQYRKLRCRSLGIRSYLIISSSDNMISRSHCFRDCYNVMTFMSGGIVPNTVFVPICVCNLICDTNVTLECEKLR